MNDEAACQGRSDDTSEFLDEIEDTDWPRCPDCGARVPHESFLLKHRLRRCAGNVDRPLLQRVVMHR